MSTRKQRQKFDKAVIASAGACGFVLSIAASSGAFEGVPILNDFYKAGVEQRQAFQEKRDIAQGINVQREKDIATLAQWKQVAQSGQYLEQDFDECVSRAEQRYWSLGRKTTVSGNEYIMTSDTVDPFGLSASTVVSGLDVCAKKGLENGIARYEKRIAAGDEYYRRDANVKLAYTTLHIQGGLTGLFAALGMFGVLMVRDAQRKAEKREAFREHTRVADSCIELVDRITADFDKREKGADRTPSPKI